MSTTTVPLGEVAEFVRGITFKPRDVAEVGEPGSVICLRTKNVQNTVDLSDVWAVPSTFVKRRAQYLQPGDVLISSANSWNLVGKCSWIPDLPWAATFGGFVTALRPKTNSVNRRYLYHWFSYGRTQQLLRSFGRKTTNISNLNLDRCRNMDFPLPTIDEQQRIAAVLDAADALRIKRREALARLDALIQAVFIGMFGGGARPPVNPGPVAVDHPAGWSWVPLTSAAEMATGHTPDRSVSEYWDGGVGWVNLNEIRRLDGRWCHGTELTITDAGVANSSAVILPVGTVCFSRTASIGFVTVLAEAMATSQDFVNWICGESLCPDYLMHAFLASRDVLRGSSSGSTHRTIYVRDAERFHALVPPVELQREFVAALTTIREQKARALSAQAAHEDLFASLQQRAFQGEL